MTDMDTRRQAAIKRVKARHDFRTHLVVYVVVNALLVVIWAESGAGYFWPIWPMAGWGIGLVLNGWDVYYRRPITDAEIQAELERELHGSASIR